ncbi:MAG: haloacid dehalogenase-like hydrolase [Pseudomonadota bacterium]
MRIGIDFDNTIICYDKVFNAIGIEQDLLPKDLPYGKHYVREYLRDNGQEAAWTKLQGIVYGERLDQAELYGGVMEFLLFCQAESIPCFIVSHKTQYPYSGDLYDLHASANQWIEGHGLRNPVFFEPTKEDKIRRVNELKCSHFIDDLPEFLLLPGFDKNIFKILFDPEKKYIKSKSGLYHVSSWDQILSMIKFNLR